MKSSGWFYLHIQLYTEHVVQSLSRVWLFAVPWTAAHQASQSFGTSWSLLRLFPLSRWCHPTISSFVLPSIFHQGLFQWVGSLHLVTKVLELQLQHQSQWIFGVDFLYTDEFDLLTVQGTLKSLLQHHSSKASILWRSAFFMVHLLYPYMITHAQNINSWPLYHSLFQGGPRTLERNLFSEVVSNSCPGAPVYASHSFGKLFLERAKVALCPGPVQMISRFTLAEGKLIMISCIWYRI